MSNSGTLPTDLDVLVVGAGLSGVNAAYHLAHSPLVPRFAVVDTHESFGGTWLIHKYPGVRTDTEAYTLGFSFKPWVGAPYADASAIQQYIGETIDEFQLTDNFFFDRQITDASWDPVSARWTVRGMHGTEEFSLTTKFLWMCHGYYRHEAGYTPEWPGFASFKGQVIHPQNWPTDIDLAGKRVVVIGSGATMATLVPNIADESAHVTVLQRSPTFFFQSPNVEPLADQLRQYDTPEEWIHEIVRRKSVAEMQSLVQIQQLHPEISKSTLIGMVAKQLPEGYDVERHFTPRHLPQDQRVCRILNGDLFAKISEGKVSMVTDEIKTFTEDGIETLDGVSIPADVVITATGFNLSVLGDVNFSVAGEDVNFANSVTYRGMLFTNLPNLAWTFGALRLSWTMRADLVSQYVCGLLEHMNSVGASTVVPELRPVDASMALQPFVDPKQFNPGYLLRAEHLMPKAGVHAPWQMSMDFWAEREDFVDETFDDGCLQFRP